MLERIQFFLTESHRLAAAQLSRCDRIVERLRDDGLVEWVRLRTCGPPSLRSQDRERGFQIQQAPGQPQQTKQLTSAVSAHRRAPSA